VTSGEGDAEAVLVSLAVEVGDGELVGVGEVSKVSAIVLTPWTASKKSTADITSFTSLERCRIK